MFILMFAAILILLIFLGFVVFHSLLADPSTTDLHKLCIGIMIY